MPWHNSFKCGVCFEHMRVGEDAFACCATGGCHQWFCAKCYYKVGQTEETCPYCRITWFQETRLENLPFAPSGLNEVKPLPDDVKAGIPDVDTVEFFDFVNE